MKASSFFDIEDKDIKEIDISGSQVTSFQGIQYFGKLEKLNISRSLISSFKYVTPLPSLKEIDFSFTPLSRRRFSREMCFFALNIFSQTSNLIKINGIKISDEEIDIYKKIADREEIENLIKEGYFIIFHPNGTYTKCTNQCSHLNQEIFSKCSTILKRDLKINSSYNSNVLTNITNSIGSNNDNKSKNNINISVNNEQKGNFNRNIYQNKFIYINKNVFNDSTTQLANNLKKSADFLHSTRIQSHSENNCFLLQKQPKFDDKSIVALKDELNSLKPPIEYQRDQIRLEAQRKLDLTTIENLESTLKDISTKLHKNENSLITANETNSRLQKELKKATINIKSQNDVSNDINNNTFLYINNNEANKLDSVVDELLEKWNELRDAKKAILKLESEFDNLSTQLTQIKKLNPPDRSLDSDLSRILAAAETLKNEKKEMESKFTALRNKISSQSNEIKNLKSQENERRKQKEELLKKIELKRSEMAEAESKRKEAQNQMLVEKKNMALEFEKISLSVQKSAGDQDLSIDDLTAIPTIE